MYFRHACGIELEGKIVVTGGLEYRRYKRWRYQKSLRTVAQFTETGAVTFFARLNTARYAHACTKFVNDKGDAVREGCKVRTKSLVSTQSRHPKDYILKEINLKFALHYRPYLLLEE